MIRFFNRDHSAFWNNMLTLALGLIETRGLIGAIEAADAMVKTSNVRLIGKDRTDPAMITIKIIGETAAVRSAVEAGAAAAQKIGQLVSKHVIPRPAEGMEKIIFDKSFLSQEEIDGILGFDASSFPGVAVPGNSEVLDLHLEPEPAQSEPAAAENFGISPGGSKDEYIAQLMQMTVHQLRNYARGIQGLSIHGRQISKANKDELISELLKTKFI